MTNLTRVVPRLLLLLALGGLWGFLCTRLFPDNHTAALVVAFMGAATIGLVGSVVLIVPLLLLSLFLQPTKAQAQIINNTQLAMTRGLLDSIGTAWANRDEKGSEACIYGYVEMVGQQVRLHFTSITATDTPEQTCLWSADSLVGGFHFQNPDDFDQPLDSIHVSGIMDILPQLRYFGIVHDTTHSDKGLVLKIFQMFRTRKVEKVPEPTPQLNPRDYRWKNYSRR